MPMADVNDSNGKEVPFLSATEVILVILGFGNFTINLIGICQRIFGKTDKKN